MYSRKLPHSILRTTVSLATVCALILTGCSSNKQAESEAELEELTVLLDWYPNAVHTFLYAAEEQGYFEDAGLQVNLQTPAGTNDAVKLVATGKADLALSYQMQVAISRAEDIPVVSLAAIVRHPLNRVFALESSGIRSPKDLVGARIGYPSIPLDEAIVSTMVKTDGGDAASLNFQDIGWDLIPALTTEKVDAIVGGYVNHEKLLLEKEGAELVTFDPSDFGVPDFYELVLVASESGVEENEDSYRKFIEAAAKGQQYTAEHPEEALKILLDKQTTEFPLDADIEKQSLDVLLPLMDAGDKPFGYQSPEAWQSVIAWLQENGQLKQEVKPEQAFRNL
ncbi:ABC transporter substrate-binding protein [Paenibacillus soyae]|uniref:ABC transporter substrate-binding protein n=1 Tax=Paenibacillus soyae TaxID=2969249 RepID=A0A9X2MPK4_9BACL|nr:ABC transporter substrate-binding protein [Paenibacillus soyae]MCR2803864.1 ABC transporter substrate-binding protein [Paenibacillus soyae]